MAAYMEWVLVNNGSAFTICPAEDDNTSLTLDPELSQPPPTHRTDLKPESTADGESEPDKRTELS